MRFLNIYDASKVNASKVDDSKIDDSKIIEVTSVHPP